MPHTILLLLSNPKDTEQIDIYEEYNEIEKELRLSSSPDLFQLRPDPSTTVDKLFEMIIRFKPSVIHFSGHGNTSYRMALEDEKRNSFLLKASEFVAALNAKPILDKLQLIVFNACYMDKFAELSSKKVPCVIGTKDYIPDETAKAFSTKFYSNLANGCSVKEAFDRSISLAEIKKLPKTDVPILLGNGDIRFRLEEKENQNTTPKKEENKTVKNVNVGKGVGINEGGVVNQTIS